MLSYKCPLNIASSEGAEIRKPLFLLERSTSFFPVHKHGILSVLCLPAPGRPPPPCPAPSCHPGSPTWGSRGKGQKLWILAAEPRPGIAGDPS